MDLLLTERGIPQLYYGTEILMKNFKNPSDAQVREDFPGGWNGDAVNKFTATGRTEKENEAYTFVKTLAVFRKNSSALSVGKTLQYIPKDDIYVFFRYTAKQRVMCIVNSTDKPVELKTERFARGLAGKTKGFDVIGKTEISITTSILLPPTSIQVIELK